MHILLVLNKPIWTCKLARYNIKQYFYNNTAFNFDKNFKNQYYFQPYRKGLTDILTQGISFDPKKVHWCNSPFKLKTELKVISIHQILIEDLRDNYRALIMSINYYSWFKQITQWKLSILFWKCVQNENIANCIKYLNHNA